MCGIVGFTGNQQALPIVMESLSKLEYRGYDSAGIAIRNGESNIQIVKSQGKLSALYEKLGEYPTIKGTSGIGHTRWATHGEPNENNSHPHSSNSKKVVAVHNGIIENYLQLKSKLIKNGYEFFTDTDTEVAVNLIDYYYNKYAHTPVDAIRRAIVRIEGSYALAIMFSDFPEEIYATRKDSPLIVAVNDNNSFLASDVPAIMKYSRTVYYLDNYDIAKLNKGNAEFYNIDAQKITKEETEIKWNINSAEKSGYNHFMLKEIFEQPTAVKNTLKSLIDKGNINFLSIGLSKEEMESINQIYIVACGSAYHVAVTAQYIIEDMAQIPVRIELASEFRYRKLLFNKNDIVIVISQSGETADSLAALREAKKQGIKTLSIVNVLGSTIARESDKVLYTLAGPEIAVATTKAYSTQLIAVYCLSIALSQSKGTITEEQRVNYLKELLLLPEKIEEILENEDLIKHLSVMFSSIKNVFFIGRGLDYSIANEGSLKLKEISYINSQAYASGELKHGTISLIEENTPVIGTLTQNDLFEKSISNLTECKSRGAYIVALLSEKNQNKYSPDCKIVIPQTVKYFYPSLAVVPLQLLSYYTSVSKGIDVDKPRNLAKSVTVE